MILEMIKELELIEKIGSKLDEASMEEKALFIVIGRTKNKELIRETGKTKSELLLEVFGNYLD